MRGGSRTGAGRKPVEIDLEQLEKLASLQCTDSELAAFFRCTTRTIEKRRREPAFKESLERGRAIGQISVRRAQMKLLEAGNATMGVWLGKQLLGQRDITPIELTGANGSEIKFSKETIDAIISEAKKTK
jgi:hypothetical protein